MRGRLKSILSYSNVMATIAVFIALGAGAYAATTFVTSSGAIRGCVTKGGQITLIKKGSRCPKGRQLIGWNQQGVPGHSGSNGSAGAPGATGSQGLRGPSDGYVATLAEGTGSATVSVAVPAGDYIAQGGCSASQINGTKNGSARATLTAPNDPNHSDLQVSTVPFTGLEISGGSKFGRTTLSTHTGFHLPNGGTITEKCGDEPGSEVTGMSYNGVQVIAEQVGTLHG